MGSSGARRAAADRKHRAAARKAATTRRRRAAWQNGSDDAQTSHSRQEGGSNQEHTIRRPDDLLRGWGRGLGMACSAFGFRETARLTSPDGRLSHGEMEAGDGLIMLASPTADYRSPKRHREACEQARKWSTVPWIIDGVLVHVEDLDRHFARAKAAGATILSDIEEGPPGRRYRAEDFEGHRWFFFEKDEG